MAQWIRTHLQMLETPIQYLAWEDPTYHVPQLQSPISRAPESQLPSPCTAATEACVPRARALIERSHHNEKPVQLGQM